MSGGVNEHLGESVPCTKSIINKHPARGMHQFNPDRKSLSQPIASSHFVEQVKLPVGQASLK